MRFASQRFRGVPRYRAQSGSYRDRVAAGYRAPRGDQGMEPLMNDANFIAPQKAAQARAQAPNTRPQAPNGNFNPGAIGIGTRLGGIL